MLLLAEGLPAHGFAVEFVCLTAAGTYASRARSAGAAVHVVGFMRRRDFHGPWPAWAMFMVSRAARYLWLTAWRYDILDAWLYHAYILAALTRPLTWPRALVAGRRSLSAYKARFPWPHRVADAIAHRGADRIVANAEAVRTDVVRREHIDPDDVLVIHNAVRPPATMTPKERRSRRAGWGATDASVVIGCVANYKTGKGLELLIRAMRGISETSPDRPARLVLVGEGRIRPSLEALSRELGVEDSVVFHGATDDARDLYAGFDVFAFASEAEGFPNVVLEAAAAGLPIVATAAGGIVEIVTEGQTGHLVPIGDEHAMVAALRRLIDDPTERRRLGEAAHREVLERYGGDRMVEEFAALYRDLADGARRPWRRH